MHGVNEFMKKNFWSQNSKFSKSLKVPDLISNVIMIDKQCYSTQNCLRTMYIMQCTSFCNENFCSCHNFCPILKKIFIETTLVHHKKNISS